MSLKKITKKTTLEGRGFIPRLKSRAFYPISCNAIKTPLRYPGGKSRVADMLIANFPEFREYREPFLGGGSVFVSTIQKKPNARYWINDLYYDLYCFWKSAKEKPYEMTSFIKTIKSLYKNGKELYEDLLKKHDIMNDFDLGVAFFILNRITFSGTSLSGGYSQGSFDGRFNTHSIKRIEEVSRLLLDVKVTNLDYSDMLGGNDDDVFVFMDPPYYTATKSALYGKGGELHKGFNHERFAETVKKCYHKWMITYDDCDFVREHFSGYNIIPFSLMYGMRNTGKDPDMRGREVIITNYDMNTQLTIPGL